MIGGDDAVIRLFNLHRSSAVDICLQILRRYWRHAVVQSGTSAIVYHYYGMIPLGKETELMVYKDNESFESWNKFGALPSNRNAMVHLLAYNDESMTMVADDLNAEEMKRLLRDIRKAIIDARFVGRADNKDRKAAG